MKPKKIEPRVHAAIEQLVAKGADAAAITVRDIRAITGTGSYGDISASRDTWLAGLRGPQLTLIEQIDERISASLPSMPDFKKLLAFVVSIADLPRDPDDGTSERQRERVKTKADAGLRELIEKFMSKPE